ncbi:hypothetical protein, partial [Citrobacter portucalensis]|uniref:hypothetical protein n=1 Tax=Citrobacter portucalensis TaxID=1639133 RepID=UPI0011EBC193
DLLCWQSDYAGGSLNVNGTIMRDTYNYKVNAGYYDWAGAYVTLKLSWLHSIWEAFCMRCIWLDRKR